MRIPDREEGLEKTRLRARFFYRKERKESKEKFGVIARSASDEAIQKNVKL
jgi:hypothetical protein